jgi:hypothetical protein
MNDYLTIENYHLYKQHQINFSLLDNEYWKSK